MVENSWIYPLGLLSNSPSALTRDWNLICSLVEFSDTQIVFLKIHISALWMEKFSISTKSVTDPWVVRQLRAIDLFWRVWEALRTQFACVTFQDKQLDFLVNLPLVAFISIILFLCSQVPPSVSSSESYSYFGLVLMPNASEIKAASLAFFCAKINSYIIFSCKQLLYKDLFILNNHLRNLVKVKIHTKYFI